MWYGKEWPHSGMHKVLHKPWGEWAHTDQVDVALARASRHQLEPRECEPPLDGTRIRHQLMTPVDDRLVRPFRENDQSE